MVTRKRLSGKPAQRLTTDWTSALATMSIRYRHYRLGLGVNVIQQVNDVQTALGLVASEMGFTLVPEQVRRLHREDIAFVPLDDKTITSPVLCCRRREPLTAIMRLTNHILAGLVQNRLSGRYP